MEKTDSKIPEKPGGDFFRDVYFPKKVESGIRINP